MNKYIQKRKQRQAFEDAWIGGVPGKDMAKALGITRKAVYMRAMRWGLPTRKPGLSPERVEASQ